MTAHAITEKILNYVAQDIAKLPTKENYNLSKCDERILGIPQSKNALRQLHTENMAAEQIWQQIELNNSTAISESTDVESMFKADLFLTVAKLSNAIVDNIVDYNETDDDGIESEEQSDENESTSQIDKTSDFEEEDVPSEQEEDELDEDIPDDLSEFSDLDKDTFADIAINEDEEDSDDEEGKHDIAEDKSQGYDSDGDSNADEEKQMESEIPNQKNKKHFKSSTVDSTFFNLRESEWVADNDIIGKSFESDGEDIDLMKDTDNEQSEDEGCTAKYNEFFDTPSSADNTKQYQESSEDETEEIQESLADETEQIDKVKSKFEDLVAKEAMLTKELEEETYLTEKQWIMKGEVKKNERPANSALEHHLDYNVAIRQKPIITEDTTKNIEKLILSRIQSKIWDDVERKVRPTADPFKFKQKLVLDEEKSKKSLSSLYEEEYMRKQEEEKSGKRTLSSILAESDEAWEELPIHKEIKKEMDELFIKLDALSNCHYTPRYRAPEIKIVSNLRAITIEEATPTTMSDATLLAPQEIVAPLRGELKGGTEKSNTDRKRERRQKKKHQKERAQREEQKLSSQLKKKDRDGLLNTEASVKFVEKAAKQGYIKVLDTDQKSVKSSKGFFDQLQANVSGRANRKRKRDYEAEGKGKKKKNKPLTVAQLLL